MTGLARKSIPTVKDVAQEAGVSVATVSRALNNKASVDPDLAARVREAAEQLSYQRNMNARGLRRRSSDTLALIISDVSNPFFSEVARGVEDVAHKNDLSVLLCNSYDDAGREGKYLGVAEAQQVAGVLLSPRQPETDISRLNDLDIPVVAIDRRLDERVDSVTVDSRDGARAATAHLLGQGWRRPACITGKPDTEPATLRLAGYVEAVEGAGVEARFVHAIHLQADSSAATAELLDSTPAPDAIFIANIHMAFGVLKELEHRGLRPGHDIGVISFDDAPWTTFISPSLSAVAQPAYDVGTIACELLVERISRVAEDPRSIVLPTSLVPRASSLRMQ